MRVAVIGAGPAGMMAAIESAQEGNDVFLIEKNNRVGKKMLITGKGRCNITSSLDISEFIYNIPGNGNFLYSVFENYNNLDIIEFLNKMGVPTKEERGNRVFPLSDKSIDVVNAFEKKIKMLKINVKLDTILTKIKLQNNEVKSIKCLNKNNNEEIIEIDKVVLATGGKTYPQTGSTGDGYKIAKELGHTITPIRPSLVPLTSEKNSLKICKQLQGLSLRNVKIKIIDETKNKKIYEDFGEMLFTHFGITGPTILSGSAHLLRYKNIDSLMKEDKIKIIIDLKPALSEEKLDARLQRDFEKQKNKEFKNSLNELLPQKLIETIIELSSIDEKKQVNEITKEERKKIVELLKKFTININGFRPIEEGIVTSGGVNIKEINPKTLESKIVKGLYFAGELIDVDAYTGGFNLQIAYSTGYTAGNNKK